LPLWIPLTIAAAFLQNARSALQKRLNGSLKASGATFARFGFGLPVALLYAAGLHVFAGMDWPETSARFYAAAAVGGLAQIGGTFCLVQLFSLRNFMVGTAYSKTEPVQAALFGLLILGETVTPLGLAAILVGVCGVVLISLGGRTAATGGWRGALFSKAAGIGILSGALFGASAVCFRLASLALGNAEVAMRAGFALCVATAFQTAAMLAYFAWRDPAELVAIRRAWLPAFLVGIVGVAGSIGWFTAMTLQKVAYVRALGQIELVFTFLSSVLMFKERIRTMEAIGCVLILSAILGILAGAA
jgi:drug/metabolite transporter (DMT)-like permease